MASTPKPAALIMHVPDGLLSPQTYLVAWGAAVPLWAWAAHRAHRLLDERTIPRLGVLTAVAFLLSTIMIPLPGGTAGHLLGVPLLALHCGIWLTFLAYSLVLVLQTLLFGAGGITTLTVAALIMGLIAAVITRGLHALLRRLGTGIAVVISAWTAIVVAATLMALVLGIQPLIAQSDAGEPLYFPFGLAITLPAIIIPHIIVGLGEGLLTMIALRRFPPPEGHATQ